MSSMVTSIADTASTDTGVFMSAASSMMAGDEARRVAGANKDAYRAAARDSRQRGADEAAEHRQKVMKILARQNVAYSAGGIDTSSGTAADVMVETAGLGELDALRIMNNAQRRADQLDYAGDWQKYQGKQAWRASRLNALGTLLSRGKQGGIGATNTANSVGAYATEYSNRPNAESYNDPANGPTTKKKQWGDGGSYSDYGGVYSLLK